MFIFSVKTHFEADCWTQPGYSSISCAYWCPFKTDLFITDHSKQTTFVSDHGHNRPRSLQTSS